MNINFSGSVVLVAGGTGGLGRAASLAFLEEGAKVIVTFRREEEYIALKNTAGTNAASLEGYPVDATDEAAVGQLVNRISTEFGKLDAVVNAIGGYAGGAKLWEQESKVLDQMLALNLRSGYTLSRAVIPLMLKQKHGAIVNVAAKAAVDHGAGAAAYAASKAAAVAMIDSLAEDVKGTGVRVNSILPVSSTRRQTEVQWLAPILQCGQSPRISRASSCFYVAAARKLSMALPCQSMGIAEVFNWLSTRSPAHGMQLEKLLQGEKNLFSPFLLLFRSNGNCRKGDYK